MAKIKETILGFSIAAVLVASWLFGFTAGSARQVIVPVRTVASCDDTLWNNIYHRQRLVIQQTCVSVTGIWQDASRGRTADGCRHEKDGDGHCWLKLDAGQTPPNSTLLSYLNANNMQNEGGNLVIEPICVYRTTQQDAKAACHNWHQPFSAPKIGAHIRVTGAWVLDTQHGHMEVHPVSRIEVLQ